MTVTSQVKQTLATLKSIHSALETYSIQAQDPTVKKAFGDASQETQAIIDNLDDRLKVLEFEEPQYRGL